MNTDTLPHPRYGFHINDESYYCIADIAVAIWLVEIKTYVYRGKNSGWGRRIGHFCIARKIKPVWFVGKEPQQYPPEIDRFFSYKKETIAFNIEEAEQMFAKAIGKNQKGLRQTIDRVYEQIKTALATIKSNKRYMYVARNNIQKIKNVKFPTEIIKLYQLDEQKQVVEIDLSVAPSNN